MQLIVLEGKKKKEITDKLIRHGKTGGSGRVIGKKRVILSGLKTGSGQSGCRSGWVGLSRIFHMKFFIFYFFYKENNMYLPFG